MGVLSVFTFLLDLTFYFFDPEDNSKGNSSIDIFLDSGNFNKTYLPLILS